MYRLCLIFCRYDYNTLYLCNCSGPVFSYTLRYIVGSGLVEMAISTNPKPTIYRHLYENTGPDLYYTEYGGMGLDYSYNLAIHEELGRICSYAIAGDVGIQMDLATPSLTRYLIWVITFSHYYYNRLLISFRQSKNWTTKSKKKQKVINNRITFSCLKF